MKICKSIAPLGLWLLLATVAAAQPADYRTAFEHFDQELGARCAPTTWMPWRCWSSFRCG